MLRLLSACVSACMVSDERPFSVLLHTVGTTGDLHT